MAQDLAYALEPIAAGQQVMLVSNVGLALYRPEDGILFGWANKDIAEGDTVIVDPEANTQDVLVEEPDHD